MLVKAFDRKLLRDLFDLKGQVAAIAVVIGAGVAVLLISVTTLDAISLTRDRFYEDHGFADVFADLVRAPEHVSERLREIPGVNLLETRVRAAIRLEVPGFPDPVRGLVSSIPDGRTGNLNRLYLREGSLPESGRADHVAVSEPFAEAHRLRAGDRINAIINGRLEALTISGIVLSPEFIYQVAPTDLMPDYERYGIFWMNRRALANAFDMDGAFNNVVISLQAGADELAVIEAVDSILAPYGGIGAHGRDDQVSHRFLSEELNQMRVTAAVIPTIFLCVAAFLLNVLVARIIRTQHQAIAVLKAFGYSNRDMAMHYGQFTGLIVLAGSLFGIALGAWAADALAGVYMEYFRFPEMSFRLRWEVILLGVSVAAGAALLGTFRVVARAVRLPPAEAMRPPAPERFRRGLLERLALGRVLDQSSRIIIRNLGRHPVKAVLSVIGIALATALLVVANFQFGAIDRMLDTQYRLVMRMNVVLNFNDPAPARSLAELRHVPGVHYAEGFRSVPVRLVNGRTDYQTAILGTDPEPKLRGLIDANGRAIMLPPEGLLLTDYLAEYLGVAPGDMLQVEVLEGHRRHLDVPVAGTVNETVGVGAYMDRHALNRLMREGPAISGAWLLTDRERENELFATLYDVPAVAGIGLISESERAFREYIDDAVLLIALVWLLFAGSIAFAVVYNNARIAFSERARELATLRVLGFTRGEVNWILIGELALLTLLAIPLGWLFGTGFAYLLSKALTMDLYRIPFVMTPRTYAIAALGILLASTLSLLAIAHRLRKLDMVSALKTVE